MDEKRSPNFRYIYANGVALNFNGNECILKFGMKDDPNTPDESMYEEVAIVLSPATAKLIGTLLVKVIAAAEVLSGNAIVIDQTKIASIDEAIERANTENKRRLEEAATRTSS